MPSSRNKLVTEQLGLCVAVSPKMWGSSQG